MNKYGEVRRLLLEGASSVDEIVAVTGWPRKVATDVVHSLKQFGHIEGAGTVPAEIVRRWCGYVNLYRLTGEGEQAARRDRRKRKS